MTGVLGFMFMLAIYVNAFFAAKRCASEYGALFAGLIAYLAFLMSCLRDTCWRREVPFVLYHGL